MAAHKSYREGSTKGRLETHLGASSDGRVRARLSSKDSGDSYSQPVSTPTSPVYVKAGVEPPELKTGVAWFDCKIDESLKWVCKKDSFYFDKRPWEIVDLFWQGQQAYHAMQS